MEIHRGRPEAPGAVFTPGLFVCLGDNWCLSANILSARNVHGNTEIRH